MLSINPGTIRGSSVFWINPLDATDKIGAIADGQEARVGPPDHYEYQNQRDGDGLEQDDAQQRRDVDHEPRQIGPNGIADAQPDGHRDELQQQRDGNPHQQPRADDVAVDEKGAESVQQQADEVHFGFAGQPLAPGDGNGIVEQAR